MEKIPKINILWPLDKLKHETLALVLKNMGQIALADYITESRS